MSFVIIYYSAKLIPFIIMRQSCSSLMVISAGKSVSGKGENQERPGLPLVYCQLKVLPEVWV